MNKIINYETIEIDGFPLKYSIKGQGIPTLIIGSHLYDQRVFSDQLANHLKMIFVDHRGFVRPPSDNIENSSFDLDVLINDIEIIRQKLKLEKFIIVGHSGHAFLALEYAKKYPDNITAVVMVASAPSNSDERRQLSGLYFEDKASDERKESFTHNMISLPEKIAADPEKRFVSYLLSAGAQSWYDYNFDATFLWQDIYTNMQMIDYVWGVVFRDIDITRDLENLDKPVFLALGRYDFLTGPPELWNSFETHFKNITVKIFEKSSHCPQYEEKKLFNQELLGWLSQVYPHSF